MPRTMKGKTKGGLTKTVNKAIDRKLDRNRESGQALHSILASNITYNGSVHGPFNLGTTQGSSYTQRKGDVIKLSHVSIRGNVVVATTTNVLRAILFQWKRDSAVAPTVGDIIDPTGTYLGNGRAPYSDLQFEKVNRAKFRVLSDRTFALGQGNQVKTFHINKKLDIELKFNAGAVTGTNHLYLLLVSDDGAATYPGVTYVAEVTYKDM